jgi:hypothetical protein
LSRRAKPVIANTNFMIGSNFTDFDISPDYSKDILQNINSEKKATDMKEFADAINSFLLGNYDKISEDDLGEEKETKSPSKHERRGSH